MIYPNNPFSFEARTKNSLNYFIPWDQGGKEALLGGSSGLKLGGSFNATKKPSASLGGSFSSNTTGGAGPVTTNDNNNNDQQNAQSEADRYADQVRGEINSGYDAYLSELDQVLNQGLPAQQASQQGIVESQYNQGVNTLTGQKTEGEADLNTQRDRTTSNQSKTLRDLSGNLQNAFRAGSIYLGSRGAGDSSAADQYSYALTKLGTQQRSDVQAQTADIFKEIDDREFKLNNIYNTEINNLEQDKNSKILEVNNWFHEQQNNLRIAKGQGQLSRGQDLASLSKTLLDRALNQIDFIKQEQANRRSALESWAMSNSQNIQQLKANLAGVSDFNAPAIQRGNISGQITDSSQGIGGGPQLFSSGNTSDEEKNKYPAGYSDQLFRS